MIRVVIQTFLTSVHFFGGEGNICSQDCIVFLHTLSRAVDALISC
jgi:hypothetical protein